MATSCPSHPSTGLTPGQPAYPHPPQQHELLGNAAGGAGCTGVKATGRVPLSNVRASARSESNIERPAQH